MIHPPETRIALARANASVAAVLAMTMLGLAYALGKFERFALYEGAVNYRIPTIDAMILTFWLVSQVALVQVAAVAACAFAAALGIGSRLARSGSDVALTAVGTLALAAHFVNPAWLIARPALALSGARANFDLDAVPEALKDDGVVSTLLGALMRPRLDPLAWPSIGSAGWWAALALWLMSLCFALAALWVGISNLRGDRPEPVVATGGVSALAAEPA